MKRYLVLRDTHGFQGRMWKADSRVEFSDDVTPPARHFKLLDGKEEAQKAERKLEDEKVALSQAQQKQVKPLPTAGTVLKNQKRVGKVADAKEDF